MKKLTQHELIALTGVLKLESIGLALTRVMKTLIDDEDLKKLTETGILEKESRIQSIKKFISSNIRIEEDINHEHHKQSC